MAAPHKIIDNWNNALSTTLRATSFVGLGWIRLDLYVYIKKLLFIRTIAMLADDSIYKRVFLCRFVFPITSVV